MLGGQKADNLHTMVNGLAMHSRVYKKFCCRNSRDTQCLSVASTVQYLERSLLLLVDLPMRTIKVCSVVFGVTSRLPVINKIH